MSMVVGMTLCVLAGYGVQRLLRVCAGTRRARVMVGAALVAGIAVDVWPDPRAAFGLARSAADLRAGRGKT